MQHWFEQNSGEHLSRLSQCLSFYRPSPDLLVAGAVADQGLQLY